MKAGHHQDSRFFLFYAPLSIWSDTAQMASFSLFRLRKLQLPVADVQWIRFYSENVIILNLIIKFNWDRILGFLNPFEIVSTLCPFFSAYLPYHNDLPTFTINTTF